MTKNSINLEKTKNKLMSIDNLDASMTDEKLILSYDESRLHKGEKWKYFVLILLLSSVAVVMVIDTRIYVALLPGALALVFIVGFILNFVVSSKKQVLEVTNDRLLFSNRYNLYKKEELLLQTIRSIKYSKKSIVMHLFSPKNYFEIAFVATNDENQKYIIFEMAGKYSNIDREAIKICNLLMKLIIDSRK